MELCQKLKKIDQRVLSFRSRISLHVLLKSPRSKIACNILQISCARRYTRRRICLLIYLQPSVYICNQVVVGTVVI